MSLSDDIAKIKQQEQQLRFTSFSEDDAWALGTQMRAAADAQKLPLVIDQMIVNAQVGFRR